MKDNLENSIKESLENFEMSYKPEAWESLSAKLDVTVNYDSLGNEIKKSLEDIEISYDPKAWHALKSKLDSGSVQTSPSSNIKFLSIAATAIVFLVSIIFYLTRENNTQQSRESNSFHSVQNIQKEIDETFKNEDDSFQGNMKNSSQLNRESGIEYKKENKAQTLSNPTEELMTAENKLSRTNEFIEIVKSENSTDRDNTRRDKENNNFVLNHNFGEKVNFNAPIVPMLCLNESIELSNNNEVELLIICPSGDSYYINPMESELFTPSESGVHRLGYHGSDGFIESNNFKVKPLPVVQFYINNDQKYENGVPVTKVETNVPGSLFKWKLGTTFASGREAEAHFFRKGYYDIMLELTGANGCTNSKTETIYIEHNYGDRGNYNLLAPSGLHLNSSEEKNRTFMPDGLKLRDVQFRMTIYSTRDGHIVFETQDSNKPWDGIDQSTGRQVGHATSYHWEVTIENPMINENPSYKGGLTVLIN